MANFIEKVFRTVLGDDAWQQHLACEQSFKEDNEEMAKLTDAELADKCQKFLDQCSPCRWPRGTPVYDAVLEYSIMPEMIARLKSER